MKKQNIIVFASGAKDGSSSTTPLGFSKTEYRQENLGGGGSGFENLVEASRKGTLDAEIVAVVSNKEHGSVHKRAERLGIPFVYFSGPYDAEHYSSVLSSFAKASKDKQNTAIDKDELWIALSGWIKHVKGLDPARTFNIHPALLSQLGGRFGGPGMYGGREHAAVKEALDKGEISETGISMHFVTDDYDRGPVFFEHRVPLSKGMSADEIESAARAAEHEWQQKITNLVVHGEIRWDSKDPKSLVVPEGL